MIVFGIFLFSFHQQKVSTESKNGNLRTKVRTCKPSLKNQFLKLKIKLIKIACQLNK
ncbi:hypothetical protein yrohd0001_17420 [Yersinia rohdei ATCC 43380]|nr:hypothetical protein yrohd0001_17420 [Yersinia rohdei ATCC 43380]